MAKITRNMIEFYIDLDRGAGAEEGKYKWQRVRKSTIGTIAVNAQEDTFGYIDSPNDTTEVTSYQPTVELESIPESTDKIYAFMQKYMMEFPLGKDTWVPFLMKLPVIEEDGSISSTTANAFIWDEAVVSNLQLDTPGQLVTWTNNLNGNVKRGTMPKTASDATNTDADFTFTPDGEEPPAEEAASTFSTRSSKKTESE